MALTQIKTTGIADNAVTDAKVVDAITSSNHLPLAGGTMTGVLNMNSQNITNAGTIQGTLSTASQTNITSVGTLSSLNVSGNAVISGTLQSDDFTLDAGSGNPDLVIKTTATGSATAQMLFLTGSHDFTLINDTANFRLYNSTPNIGVDVIKVIGSSSDILFGDVGNSRHASLDYSNGDFVVNKRLGVGIVPSTKFTVKSSSAGAIASGIGFYNAGDSNLACAIFEENTNPTSGEIRLYSGGSEKVYLRANSSSSNAFLFKGGQMQDITANNTGIQYRANWDTGFINRIDNNFDGASADASYMRFKIASGAGSQNTALTLLGNGQSNFSGNINVDNGGTSIITVDGNNSSGDDGRILIKGHTASNSRALIHFNNGVSSGGLDWRIGCLRYSNAFVLSLANDDYNSSTNVISIDGNRKIGIGSDPSSSKLKVYNDATDYTVQFQNNQGDGAVLDLYASASDDHAFDPIFKVRTDADDLFMIDNAGHWYSGDNFVSNPWDASGSSNYGSLYFQHGSSSLGQTFATSTNVSAGGGFANWYSNIINASSTTHRHVQWMNDGTSAGTITWSASNQVAYNTSQSDKTLKKNFANWTENVLDSFDKINPQLFHFKIQKDSEEKTKGFIAQDMLDKFPEAYPLVAYGEGDNQTEKYQFNPSGMVVYLMKAIQELSAKVNALEGN